MPSELEKQDWLEITLSTGLRFYLTVGDFTGSYATFVGQHISRMSPYNKAYEKIGGTGDTVILKKKPDNSFYVNFNQTVTAIKVDKKIEVPQ